MLSLIVDHMVGDQSPPADLAEQPVPEDGSKHHYHYERDTNETGCLPPSYVKPTKKVKAEDYAQRAHCYEQFLHRNE